MSAKKKVAEDAAPEKGKRNRYNLGQSKIFTPASRSSAATACAGFRFSKKSRPGTT
jgi:hypothetical protein